MPGILQILLESYFGVNCLLLVWENCKVLCCFLRKQNYLGCHRLDTVKLISFVVVLLPVSIISLIPITLLSKV